MHVVVSLSISWMTICIIKHCLLSICHKLIDVVDVLPELMLCADMLIDLIIVVTTAPVRQAMLRWVYMASMASITSIIFCGVIGWLIDWLIDDNCERIFCA